MYERVLTVKYVPFKDCFCYLSLEHFKNVDHGAALEVNCGRGSSFLSLGPPCGFLKEGEIGINSVYAKVLNFNENETATVKLYKNVPAIETVAISTLTKDDYKIVELLADNIELTLLNQIRILYKDQKFVVWVSNSINVTVLIDSIEPTSPGWLNNSTKLIVKEPTMTKPEGVTNDQKTPRWSFSSIFSNPSTEKVVEKHPLENLHGVSIKPLILRLLPASKFSITLQHFDAFINVPFLPKNFFDSGAFFRASLLVPPEDEVSSPKTITLHLKKLDKSLFESEDVPYLNDVLLVSDCVFYHFAAKTSSKVSLEKLNVNSYVDTVEICVNAKNSRNAVRDFKEFLADGCKGTKLLLNANVTFALKDYFVQLKFDQDKKTCCFFDEDSVRSCEVVVSETIVVGIKSVGDEKRLGFFEGVPSIEDILKKSLMVYRVDFASERKIENILIVGKPGSGKTTMVDILTRKLSERPFFMHVETLQCKNIKGKTIESLQKILITTFSNLIYYQPAILLIEDIHTVCSEGEDQIQETLYFNKVSEMLTEMFDNYLTRNKISVIATCENTLKLNGILYSSRGKHFFKNVFTVDELNKEDRKSFVTFLFKDKCRLENVDLDVLAVKTEGFVVQDVVDFVDKALYEMYKDETDKVTMDHCESALKNTSALSLRDVKLHSPGNRDLSDIGGLDDVKTVLIESMLWPIQYPNVFGKAPLRLQSGLLLYGPPGTGKTILAGAAAKHCGLRLISIKGPELLSKYVGASEQAVRNVFQKAQSAKPCILFFDEFDSLASKRGHDNTGVTDRVVNQFLTQLDGIESLSGVCVLAATSRPDLLDPALLRPGRLDKKILCPLPDKKSRTAILKALSKPLMLADDVDFVKIAEKTEGFSGADLQSVLYTAQLSSVEHLLENDDEVNKIDSAVVNQNHLEEALCNTRPSLTAKERRKYERIYSKFRKGFDVDEFEVSQRATMA